MIVMIYDSDYELSKKGGKKGGIDEITDEDVKKVLDSTMEMSLENIKAILKRGELPVVKPVLLSNQYTAGMSLDVYEKTKVRHMSVANSRGITDPAIADMIALRILGKGFQYIGPMNLKNVFHYMKVEK